MHTAHGTRGTQQHDPTMAFSLSPPPPPCLHPIRFEAVERVVFIEGAVGIDIVRDPVDGSLCPLSPDGCLVVERLSKDKANLG